MNYNPLSEFNSPSRNKGSRRKTLFPNVCTSAMTTSIEEEDRASSDLFINTMNTFPLQQLDLKQGTRYQADETDQNPTTREIRSVTMNERYEKVEGLRSILSKVKDEINEGNFQKILKV